MVSNYALIHKDVIKAMTPIEARIKEVYERKLGRELGETEVLEIGLWYRQFAELLLRWSKDDAFVRRLSGRSQRGSSRSGVDEAGQRLRLA